MCNLIKNIHAKIMANVILADKKTVSYHRRPGRKQKCLLSSLISCILDAVLDSVIKRNGALATSGGG